MTASRWTSEASNTNGAAFRYPLHQPDHAPGLLFLLPRLSLKSYNAPCLPSQYSTS